MKRFLADEEPLQGRGGARAMRHAGGWRLLSSGL
ncbi:hypothetical protein HNQ58_000402 [Rehaibacterium terrae]|uniref:Uncharacterized protein n=1 Tax=Rehaibacterium terrae TaxID=1341696 RepID=A0A7W7XXA5_9GAMM|nr:hypothetical protein [Rehaibacterium terrae]